MKRLSTYYIIHYLPLTITSPYHRPLRLFFCLFFIFILFSFIFSSSILEILYHFPFSFSSQSQLTFPPVGGNLAVKRSRGTVYHVTHVTRTNHTKHDILSHTIRSLSFITVFLNGLDSRYFFFAESHSSLLIF